MARHFVDTSALVKLYRNEALSLAVQAVVSPDDTLVVSGLTPLEFQSAFLGLARQKKISQGHAKQRFALFKMDLTNCELVPVTQGILAQAESLLDRFAFSEGLRPADAIQLSCALHSQTHVPIDAFLTTDEILKACAAASGFVVKP